MPFRDRASLGWKIYDLKGVVRDGRGLGLSPAHRLPGVSHHGVLRPLAGAWAGDTRRLWYSFSVRHSVGRPGVYTIGRHTPSPVTLSLFCPPLHPRNSGALTSTLLVCLSSRLSASVIQPKYLGSSSLRHAANDLRDVTADLAVPVSSFSFTSVSLPHHHLVLETFVPVTISHLFSYPNHCLLGRVYSANSSQPTFVVELRTFARRPRPTALRFCNSPNHDRSLDSNPLFHEPHKSPWLARVTGSRSKRTATIHASASTVPTPATPWSILRRIWLSRSTHSPPTVTTAVHQTALALRAHLLSKTQVMESPVLTCLAIQHITVNTRCQTSNATINDPLQIEWRSTSFSTAIHQASMAFQRLRQPITTPLPMFIRADPPQVQVRK